ncbi:MAG: acyl-CoA dehydratase activase [Sphaerochaetaceae bacterium]|nr:acyl-CoA dehydratase activase [Sphaerochaetaceae bacterium]MDC7249907.1 acyl-CoA dehydratase activase [Sphaerochaetaceae bacterium]
MKLGLDIGSTTIKCVLTDDENKIIFKTYKRHFSKIQETTITLLETVKNLIDTDSIKLSLTGSAGMGMANRLNVPFIQEVYATRTSILEYNKGTDVVIELGGEDAKILFLDGNLEVRMNGTCAGGTGSFIDQMATLLDLETEDLNEIAKRANLSYPIASRCGVFAKGDIQPLINQGAKKSDIVLSIFQAVVNQTISGLAQGRPIKGNVIYLGGPLTFMSVLRDCFDKTLNTQGLCPENSLYYVAIGTALGANEEFSINNLITLLKTSNIVGSYNSLPPLFETEDDLLTFRKRHQKASLKTVDPSTYKGDAYLGIDSGSTTIKMCIIDESNNLLHTRYQSNKGNPVEAVREFLNSFITQYPDINIKKGCSTGYGELLIQKAFNLEYSLVETMAHYKAAKYFDKETDFIIDIGGQDIKCFKIVDGVIDDIFLNEACSSGCGSFLQTFFQALGYSTEEASSLALKSTHPVDLGSRCTVFMNSSVKQAQKDGAKIEDIFAGLAISVVKNALYKVIRTNTGLGKHIVVQGGTFLNDAVLRSFEMELNLEVTRCKQAGLMGAFGCALYAKEQHKKDNKETTLLNLEQLANFSHSTSTRVCKGCTNHCQLTINKFEGNRTLISGNKCERFTNPTNFIEDSEILNIFRYKQNYIKNLKPVKKGNRGRMGLPLALGLIELAPFYYTLFTELGYEVHITPFSKRDTYLKGQSQVPSDTICYPAKLVHGHVIELIEQGIENIFIPNSSFNIDEKKADNNYNCPVVAYYGEVISKNTPQLEENNINYINDYISVANKRMFKKRLKEILSKLGTFSNSEINNATNLAYKAQETYTNSVINKGKEIVELAREKNMPIMVLCGRPYHIDPEVNHGIDDLILQLKCAIISEDSLSSFVDKKKHKVLNQWTYHNRMYLAAHYVGDTKDMNIIQLVSFGCGLDAVTADEVKDILKSKNKIYTQLKIDEIANLGSVKIRLRSLLAALKEDQDER